MPIWFTEFAWRTAPTPKLGTISPARQADLLHKTVTLVRTRYPYAKMLVWFLVRDESPTSYWRSGLATFDWQHKPAYGMYQRSSARTPRPQHLHARVCPRGDPAYAAGQLAAATVESMLRLALAQLDLTVGALAENRKRIADACCRGRGAGGRRARARAGARDLGLSARGSAAAARVPARLQGRGRALAAEVEVPLVVGCPWLDGDRARNAALVIAGGEIVARYDKRELPNYGVFDEERTFSPGRGSLHIETPGGALALTICEDVWLPDAVAEAAALGASCVLNISASPYHLGKGQSREEMLATRARDGLCAVAYCNLVGGQDELVFDGRSAVFGPDGDGARARRVVRRGAADLRPRPRRLAAASGCATRACAAAGATACTRP